MNGQLELGLLVLLSLLLFATANLLDDERRQHRILHKAEQGPRTDYSMEASNPAYWVKPSGAIQAYWGKCAERAGPGT